jgi:hypothetical protein
MKGSFIHLKWRKEPFIDDAARVRAGGAPSRP